MVNYLVDTNVILRFLLADDERQSPIAQAYFLNQNYRLLITTIAFCEVVWVMKKRVKIPNAKIVQLLTSLVANNRVVYDKMAFDNGIAFLSKGGDFADGVIAHSIKNHYHIFGQNFDNVTFITFDKNASQLATDFNLANQLL